MTQIELPSDVNFILYEIRKFGYQAHPVGGCVRDFLMDKTPKDWDIATNAKPDQLNIIFAKQKRITQYAKHGTIGIIVNSICYEITTYRLDGNYGDHRHPDQVTFTDDLFQDLSRRDFTVNALALSSDNIIDYFDGVHDIENKIIRCVGDPLKRFSEDALRILRALRFCSTLGFTIEAETQRAAYENLNLIESTSKERIFSELCQIVTGKNAASAIFENAEIIFAIIPELKKTRGFDQTNPHHIYDVWEHTTTSIKYSPRDLAVRLTLLFHDIGKPDCFTVDKNGIGHFYGHPEISASIASDVLKRFRCKNSLLEEICTLIRYHDTAVLPNSISIKRFLNKVGIKNFKKLQIIKSADIRAQSPDYIHENIAYLKQINDIFKQIIADNECYTLEQLAVNGNDLIEVGIPQGNRIGVILDSLLQMVINEETENKKDNLLKVAQSDYLKKL